MESATLQADPRQAEGTRSARRLRRTGKLPAVIYGHGQEPQPVSVNAHDLGVILGHGVHVLELDVEGDKKRVLIKDVQFDHLGSTPVHVDFAVVDVDERVEVSVPIEFKGEPKGVQEGGLVEYSLGDLEIECRVVEIPSSIRVDVSHLEVGMSLHASEVELPAGATLVTQDETIVAAVRMKAAAVSEADAEMAEGEEGAAGEPEIIGEKSDEDGD